MTMMRNGRMNVRRRVVDSVSPWSTGCTYTGWSTIKTQTLVSVNIVTRSLRTSAVWPITYTDPPNRVLGLMIKKG